jgi:hypothetical protein
VARAKTALAGRTFPLCSDTGRYGENDDATNGIQEVARSNRVSFTNKIKAFSLFPSAP